jgi:hypothetical protein
MTGSGYNLHAENIWWATFRDLDKTDGEDFELFFPNREDYAQYAHLVYFDKQLGHPPIFAIEYDGKQLLLVDLPKAEVD